MSINFNFENKDYNINIVKGKESDITVNIHGMTYSVLADAQQLDVIRKIFESISSESLSSVEDLSDRIGAYKGVSAVKTHSIAIDTLQRTSIDLVSTGKKHTIETGIIRTVPILGAPSATIERRMQELNVPGVSVAVMDHGEVEAFGYGELAEPTLIQAASISKTVNALTILSLIDQCRKATQQGYPSGLVGDRVIDLDTDVSTLLEPTLWNSIDPDGMLNTRNPKMTIRELLSHTAGTSVSGFGGYLRLEEVDKEILLLKDEIARVTTGEPDRPSLNIGALTARLEKLEQWRLEYGQKIPLSTDDILMGKGNSDPVRVVDLPGTKVQYSGGGTTILQKVVEVVTGKSYETVVQERVFDKLKMNDSTYHPKKLPASSGHDVDGSIIPGQFHIHPELAAAGLWTTPSDLVRMGLGIQQSVKGSEESLLSPELAKEMITIQTKSDSNGLGVFITSTPTSTWFFHNGSNAGFKCMFLSNLEGQGAAVMTNADFGGPLYEEVILSIARAYGWADADHLPMFSKTLTPDEVASIGAPIDMEKWKGVVGEYQFQEHTVEVSLLGDKTFVTVDGGMRFELTPLSDNIGSYSSEGSLGVLRFQRAGDVVTGLNLFGADHAKV